MKRLTQDEFIERAIKIHGGRYDYSLVEYKTGKDDIEIICPVHGVFKQQAYRHLYGAGCLKCRFENHKLKPETIRKKGKLFIEKAKQVHGDRYDYSQVEYKGTDEKVLIVCKKHGGFWQTPSNHLKGFNCPHCFPEERLLKNKNHFLDESQKVHLGKGYDYSLVEYKNINTNIKIICPKHGIFEVTPYRHMKGQCCPKCVGPNYRGLLKYNNKKRLSKEEFIEKSISAHGKKYDYSLVEYKNNLTKVKIICKKHGVFEQEPSNHMKGVGCPKCNFEKLNKIALENSRRRNNQVAKDFISRARKIHKGKRYDYSQTVYTSWECKVKVICPKHGAFYIAAHNHLAGAGCPSCSDKAFRFQKPAIFYYLRIERKDKRPIYKIGITNKSVKERYNLKSDRNKFKVIHTKKFLLGAKAWEYEKNIKENFKVYLYIGSSPLSRVGTSEMFVKDILHKDLMPQ